MIIVSFINDATEDMLFMKNVAYQRRKLKSSNFGISLASFLKSHSLWFSEIIFLDLSRNVVVEFGPITVVVVVSLTVDSRFPYGFDGWQYNL